ncbi:uncharacterized protein PGTG_13534 [Puccinia graminis f. sp. tritici CRL 75-36-700-3]|uniref:Uncharacterized protein n=1 Tax=Puccinia graminis f. sp. tritici (strain CRL 75-36-700-3 / race SCCL) TaxID=418459 RepID=E3KTP7_PUCGT|nr:uncharacterized protein PGTG_13534 [Puccinia graminis f. sp. tritici CRL 75-36-700-3]EFP87748.1 hypothetical protein PGTG_13534 [Puccinia graminis f. sp. tritici CRL 75-36-700-3]
MPLRVFHLKITEITVASEQLHADQPKDVEKLTRLLMGEPQFTVMLGPPNSGKTALARHGSFLEAFRDEGSLARAQNVFYERLFVKSKTTSGETSRQASRNQTFRTKRAKTFKELGSHLKPWPLSHGGRPPVLIIDEENVFKRMNDDMTGGKMFLIKSYIPQVYEYGHFQDLQLPHFARDLDPCHSLPTLTALSEPALRAMERLIEDLKQEVIK